MAKKLATLLLLASSTFVRVNCQSSKSIVEPGPYGYVGCFSDNPDQRTIATQFTPSGPLTLENCAAVCQQFQHTFFGTEDGDQCFCGDGIMNSPSRELDTECNDPCAGDSTEACGAANIISVYSSDSQYVNPGGSPGPGSTSSQGTGPGTTGAHTSHKSHKTKKHALSTSTASTSTTGGKRRHRSHKVHKGTSTVTSTATSSGGTTASHHKTGKHHKSHKSSGTTTSTVTSTAGGKKSHHHKSHKHQKSSKSSSRAGTVTKTGSHVTSSTATTTSGSKKLHHKTHKGHKHHKSHKTTQTTTGTVKTKSTATKPATTTGSGHKHHEGPVNKPVVQPGQYRYVGCYNDDAQSPVLSTAVVPPSGTNMTLEVCATLCHDHSRAFFGVENGRECFCGTTINPNAVTGTRCNTTCAGDASEYCGGPLAINVYTDDPTFYSTTTSTSKRHHSTKHPKHHKHHKHTTSKGHHKPTSKPATKTKSTSTSKHHHKSHKHTSHTTGKTTGKTTAKTTGKTTRKTTTKITSKTTTTTTTSSAHTTPTVPPPAPTTSGTTKQCYVFATIGRRDTCRDLEIRYSITFKQLRGLNPSIDALCSNLVYGNAYCVSGVPARVAATSSTRTTRTTTTATQKSSSGKHTHTSSSSSSSGVTRGHTTTTSTTMTTHGGVPPTTTTPMPYFTSQGKLCVRRTVLVDGAGIAVSTYPLPSGFGQTMTYASM